MDFRSLPLPRDRREDLGLGEGLAGGFEIGDLFFDGKASGLEVGFELRAGKPVKLLAGLVGGGEFALLVVDFVAMLAMEKLLFAIDLMHRVNARELAIVEQGLVIGIPIVFGQLAEDFREWGEGAEVERAVVLEHGGEAF